VTLTNELRPDLVRRYLAALGVSHQQPHLGALQELVAAHLTHIPFENVSKLYNRRHHALTSFAPIELFLDGIERYHFGGTCYSNNFHFYSLLATLGYDVKLCGADMTNPDVHILILVTLDGHEYLVDGGYGAPFLAPMPRDLATDYVITLGQDRYVLKPQDANGRSRLEMYRDGKPKHGYLVKPNARTIEEFQQVIAESFRPEATFLNALLLARFYPDRSVMIHNLALIESQGSRSTVHSLASRDELAATVTEQFGIPREIVAEVIGELGDLKDVWS
jgi:N-hydroxyarylamine O-acetyltransferase